MKLSDVDILESIKKGEIQIDPPVSEECIGSFSIDLRLGAAFRTFVPTAAPFIDLSDNEGIYSPSAIVMEERNLEEGGKYFLHPGEFALGITRERVRLADDIVGWLDGRSSLARVGLMVHITAHTIDPGWDGQITLEFFNSGRLPLALAPGLRICAVTFERLSSKTSRPYVKKLGAKYGGQTSPLASQIARDLTLKTGVDGDDDPV
jgi:dCTP deaminase